VMTLSLLLLTDIIMPGEDVCFWQGKTGITRHEKLPDL
jgi:hypothetical protein